MLRHAIPLALLCLPLAAQGEEAFLFFEPADAAFARAQREHKRVLVYQDWPG